MKFSELCKFTPQQWRASEAADSHRYFLFGGRRGVLKSYWLRWYLLRRLLTWYAQGFRDVDVLLACENMPTLRDRQISKIEKEFPRWLGEVKTTQRRGFGFHLREAYGGGMIAFRSLDDPKRFRGPEFAGVGIDELTQNPEFLKRGMSLFDVLRGSLRWPGIDDVFFAATSNPDGPGQLWVRKLFVERNLGEELEPEREMFLYQKGEVEEEAKHLLPNSYWRMLSTLSPSLKRAWVDGDWYVNFEGLVYSDFGGENLLEDFKPNLKSGFELAFDDGFVDPRAILFVKRGTRDCVVFDEIYRSRQHDDDAIREVLARCAFWCGVELPSGWGVMSLGECSQWCERNGVQLPELAVGSSEATALMSRFRLANIPARGGTHTVVDGIKHVRRYVLDAEGHRHVKVVAHRCPNFVSELTAGYRYPDRVVSDSEKPLDGNDHACDAFRYWAWLRLPK